MNKELEQILKELNIDIKKGELEAFSSIYSKLLEIKSNIFDEKTKKNFDKALRLITSQDDSKQSLFPNKLPTGSFGMPTPFTDSYSSAFDIFDSESKVKECFSIQENVKDGKSIRMRVNTSYQLSLKFEDDIKYFEEDPDDEMDNIFDFAKRVIKDGTILQHYCALWNYAINIQNSLKFPCVKIDNILSTFLKKPSDGYFRQSTRQNFTKSIRVLQKIKIRLPVQAEMENKKLGKVEYMNIPLLDFSLSTENRDGTVILSFIGSLYGGSELNRRARMFPKGIFDLDPKNEGERVSLVFKIATRFDQLNQKPIEWTREKLIKHSGLSKTDCSNKAQASMWLNRTLDRLVEIGCIANYNWNYCNRDMCNKVTIYSIWDKTLVISG